MRLPEDQRKVVRLYRDTFRDLWAMRGKSPEEGLTYYLTHLLDEGIKAKVDVSDIIQVLPEELRRPAEKVYEKWLIQSDFGNNLSMPPPDVVIPKNLIDNFIKRRKGLKEYPYDIQRVYPVYLRHTLRKLYREPVIQKIYPELENLRTNPVLYANAKNWVNYYLGRVQMGEGMKYPGFSRFSNMMRRKIYAGTLEANPAAALLNATQVINVFSEIGHKWTFEGIRQLVTPEGRDIFAKSGVVQDLLMGRTTRPTDFFSKVEYWNRGVTYLAERARQLNRGITPEQADLIAKKLVRKTQFWYGLDMPQILRGNIGKTAGMFMSYPIKQTELLAGWVKRGEWNKLGRFLGWSYVLGGPKAILPYKDIFGKMPFVSDQDNEKIDQIFDKLEDYSFSGLLGVNLAPKFGWGIFPGGPTAPVRLGVDIGKAGIGLLKGETEPTKKFITQDLPMLIPGGVQGRKMIQAGVNIGRGYKEGQRGRKTFETTLPTEVKRVLIGQPLKEARTYEIMGRETKERTDYTKTRSKIIDLIIESEKDQSWDNIEKAQKLNQEWNENHPEIPIRVTTKDVNEERYLKTLTYAERKNYYQMKGLKYKYEPQFEEIGK